MLLYYAFYVHFIFFVIFMANILQIIVPADIFYPPQNVSSVEVNSVKKLVCDLSLFCILLI